LLLVERGKEYENFGRRPVFYADHNPYLLLTHFFPYSNFHFFILYCCSWISNSLLFSLTFTNFGSFLGTPKQKHGFIIRDRTRIFSQKEDKLMLGAARKNGKKFEKEK